MSNYHTKEVPYFYHIELNVSDLETMMQFYTNVIGLQVLFNEKNRVILGVSKHPLITLYRNKSTTRNQGLYHFALLLENRIELANVLYHLLSIDYPLTGASDHIISEAIYFNDPEGNGIELAVDRDKSFWPYSNGNLDIMYRNKPLDIPDLLENATSNGPIQLSSNTVLGHIHLHVHDVVKTGEFYKKVLNMDTTIDLTPSALFLSYAGYHHHVAINTWNTYKIANESDENLGLRSLFLQSPDDTYFELIKNRLHKHSVFFTSDDDILSFDDPAKHHIIITK